MVQISVSYYGYLIEILDELLQDLRVSNPEYRTAFDVGDNPVIQTLAQKMGFNPMYFAEPTERGVVFDLKKLSNLRKELETRHADALQIAREVIDIELSRLNATSINVSVTPSKRISLKYAGKNTEMSVEQFVQLTMGLPDNFGALALWERFAV